MFNPSFWTVTQPLGQNNLISVFVHILPSAGLCLNQIKLNKYNQYSQLCLKGISTDRTALWNLSNDQICVFSLVLYAAYKAAKTIIWRHPGDMNASKWLLLASWTYKQPFYRVPQLWAAPSPRQLVLSRILQVWQDRPWMMRSDTVQEWAVGGYSPITD